MGPARSPEEQCGGSPGARLGGGELSFGPKDHLEEELLSQTSGQCSKRNWGGGIPYGLWDRLSPGPDF